MTREAWDRECKRRVRNLVFGQPMKAGVTAAPPMSPDIAIIAAQSSMSRDFGPRPPKAETGKGPGLLRLAWGFLFKREETQMQLSKTAKKSGISFAVVILGAIAAAVVAPETQQAAVQALADVPFGQQIAVAACAGIATGLINVVKHLRPKQ